MKREKESKNKRVINVLPGVQGDGLVFFIKCEKRPLTHRDAYNKTKLIN